MSKKEKIPKAVKNAIWNTYIGNCKGIGQCYVGCGENISHANFECGHIISEKKGGYVDLLNLRPICSSCNKSIGTKNMREFVNKYRFNSPLNREFESNNVINSIDNKIKCYIEDTKKNNKKMIFDDKTITTKTNSHLCNLSVKELKYICGIYGIKQATNKKNIIENIDKCKKFNYDEYIKNELNECPISVLKLICHEYEISSKGSKKDLIEKMLNHDTYIEVCHFVENDCEDYDEDYNDK